MNDRIDALSDDAGRRGLFPAPLLDTDEDPVLQSLVSEAATTLGAPIALVSLVLDRVQFFRAHVGLPPDLAATRATDRDVSFCQLVVRDEGTLVVEDAATDARVPQTLVRTHGVRAYMGAPVRVNDAVLGSLCVIDANPRTFSDAERAALLALAEKVSARCAELSAAAAGARLGQQVSATQDAFPELRNQLLMLEGAIDEAAYERSQLAPALRAAAFGGATRTVLQQAEEALEALGERLRDASDAARRIGAQAVALESVLSEGFVSADLDEALSRAVELSRHLMKLLPGVELPAPAPHPPLRASRATAVAVLTNLLRAMGWRALDGPGRVPRLRVSRRVEADALVVRVQADGRVPDDLDQVPEELSLDVGRREGVRITATGGAVEARFSLR
jgi:GAF domain-containing protein